MKPLHKRYNGLTMLLFVVTPFLSSCGGGGSTPSNISTSPLKLGLNNSIVKSSTRGNVKLQVYLPPDWEKAPEPSYPVIFFLHGQGGDEKGFFRNVEVQQINDWINQKELIPFVLVSIASYYNNGVEQQWSTPENEHFLTSNEETELRAYALKHFNAGDTINTDIKKTSIHGHSRGARGAIHYAVKFPDKFTSAVADAFVSAYALEEEQQNALDNKTKFLKRGIKLRLSVGDQDQFEINRRASIQIHNYFDAISLPHEYEVLTPVNHSFYSLWNSDTRSNLSNGLYELKFHASTW